MTHLAPTEARSPGMGPATVDIVGLAEMRRLARQWDALASAALVPNPYYSRRMIESQVAGGVLDAAALRFVVLWNDSDLVGLLPYLIRAGRCGWKRIDTACTSPYTMLSTPLIARLAGIKPAAFDWVERLLDAIVLNGRGEPFLLPLLSLSCDVGGQIVKAVQARKWPYRIFDPFERPVADLAETYEAYSGVNIGRNRRKSIRRLRRRLGETGEIRHEVSTHGAALASAVEAFLALEESGWKGRSGTALACRPETATMLRAMLDHAAGDVNPGMATPPETPGGTGMRADLLLLDERPIAASVGFVGSGVAHMWKIADDEAMRRYGSGIVLEDAILRQAHLDESLRQLDSAALPGSALEAMYGGRTLIGDLVFIPSPRRDSDALLAIEDLRRRFRRVLKSLRGRSRPRPVSRRGPSARASRR